MAPKIGVEYDVAKRVVVKRQDTKGETSTKATATQGNAVLAAGDNKPSPSSSSSQSASTDNGDNGNGGGILGGINSIVNGVTSQVGSAVGLPTSSSSSSAAETNSSSTNNSSQAKQTASSSSSSTESTPTQTQDSQTSSTPSSTSTSSPTSTTDSSSSLTLNPLASSTPLASDVASSTFVSTSFSDGTAVTTFTTVTGPGSDSSPSPTSLASQTTSGSSSFFNNKPLVGAVFGIGGLVALVLIVSVLTLALRRARRSRLENDAADVDGTIDWSADAGVGGSLGYTGMPIIGQLERGSSLNRSGSGRSNSSRNASNSPIGSEDGLLGARSTSANGYYNNYGASNEGPAPMSNLGRRPSNGEQQTGMAMNNAMPVSMGMPLNRAVSVNRQEGAPVNVPGQPFVPPSNLYGMSNAPRAYGGSQQQVRAQRQSIGAYAFQTPSQLPYAQPRAFSPPNQQQRSQQAPIGAYPTAQHGRNGSESDGANTFGRGRSGSDGTVPDSPGDEGDYYAEYNYGNGPSAGVASGLRVANE